LGAAEWRLVSSNPRTEFVAVDGLRLRTVRHGEGPPLRLINGLGAPAETWLPLVRHLADYELIAFDLPGCARSSTPAFPLGMRALGAIAAAVMERVGHPRADGLGYSLGGIVALELAHRHPDCVNRLVLCATTPGFPSLPPRPFAAWLMLTPSRYGDRAAANPIVPVIAGGRPAGIAACLTRICRHGLPTHPACSGIWASCTRRAVSAGISGSAALRSRRWSWPGMTIRSCPCPNARYLAWATRGARLRVMRGAGHLMLIDNPRPASRLIRKFLQEEIVSHGRKLAA
jgi:pimeloyl-ACP methyl ester carboxylesterase